MTTGLRHLNVVPKTTESKLATEVRQVVASEIRIAGLVSDPRPVLPPPSDLDAEQELVSLLLAGYKTPSHFKPLKAQHFYARLYGLIFEAAEAVCDRGDVCEIGGIGLELKDRGWVGPLLPELEQIRDCTPFINDRWVQRQVARVMDMAVRRQLVDTMQRCDLALRTGEADADVVRDRLERFFAGVLG